LRSHQEAGRPALAKSSTSAGRSIGTTASRIHLSLRTPKTAGEITPPFSPAAGPATRRLWSRFPFVLGAWQRNPRNSGAASALGQKIFLIRHRLHGDRRHLDSTVSLATSPGPAAAGSWRWEAKSPSRRRPPKAT